MASDSNYKIWAVDDVVYGPVDLETLEGWVRDERVVADTWIYRLATQTWTRAGELRELQPAFGTTLPASASLSVAACPLVPGIRPGVLRRVKIFSGLNDQQLGRLAQLMTVEKVPTFREICHQGQPGDALFAVLEGEARARILVDGKETTLATFQAGDSFGEMTLFDDGPRSADVIANAETTLLKISAERFEKLCAEIPDLATPLLLAIGRTLAGRIRIDNKRIGSLVGMSRLGH